MGRGHYSGSRGAAVVGGLDAGVGVVDATAARASPPGTGPRGHHRTRYRLFTGDITENTQLNREARAKPLPASSHDIVRRVQPLLYDTVKQYGNT